MKYFLIEDNEPVSYIINIMATDDLAAESQGISNNGIDPHFPGICSVDICWLNDDQVLCHIHVRSYIYRGYPAKRALSAMRKHGG